jgi:hypothetical protein
MSRFLPCIARLRRDFATLQRFPGVTLLIVTRVVSLSAACLAMTACLLPHRIPPPATPEPAPIMAHDPGPPAAGQQTVGQSARVTESMSEVCDATPCAVHMKQGRHILQFVDPDDRHRLSFATIDVADSPVAYRHALGHSSTSAVAIAGFTVGFSGLVVGAVGGVGMLDNHDRSGNEALVLVGGGMVLTGLAMWMLGMGTVQHGSGVQWTPMASPLASQ